MAEKRQGGKKLPSPCQSRFKYSIVSCFEKRYDHMWSSFCWPVFAWTLARDVASGVQSVPMHPRGSAGLPEDFLPAYAESS